MNLLKYVCLPSLFVLGETQIAEAVDNKTTDKNGMLSFELGVAPQSQIWKYTFKEINPPEGYNPIVDLAMTVTFDQYGRISNQVSSKQSRLNAVMEDNYYNCHNISCVLQPKNRFRYQA